jgi:5-methylcytosine-specific restriction protein A
MPKRSRTADALLVQQGDRCAVCDAAIGESDDFEVDHKVRLVDGGTDELSNKHVLCLPCHRAKTRRENATLPATVLDINEVIRTKQANSPRQVHQRYSIHQLRGWWLDGALRLAECNRTPVWEPAKRRAFVHTLLEGGITPPVFVNLLRQESEARDIYDGGNRITSIMQFFSGELHLQYSVGRRTVLVCYNTCRVKECRGCVSLDATNRRMLESRMVDVFEWESLSTQDACDMAQHLNEGTPMSIGEKLKLLCGRNTPRARMLKYLYDSADFQSVAQQDRERDRKVLALFLRNVIAPDLHFTSGLMSNIQPLENFYRSEEAVDERHVQVATRRLAQTACLLASRAKTQRNVLICLLGLRLPGCDLESALLDDDAECSVEDLLERYRGVRA